MYNHIQEHMIRSYITYSIFEKHMTSNIDLWHAMAMIWKHNVTKQPLATKKKHNPTLIEDHMRSFAFLSLEKGGTYTNY